MTPVAPVIDEGYVQAVASAGSSLGLPHGALLSGRVFIQPFARALPNHDAPVTARLMADSVHPLVGLSQDGWWYEISSGYVPREALQPIMAYEAPPLSTEDGYYEVVAPMTTLRDYCSPLAGIAARLAYGAVLYVRDRITDDRRQVWYGVTTGGDDSPLWGWVQAAHLRRWEAPGGPVAAEPAIWIDTAQRKLSAYDGERLLGECAVCCPSLAPGAGRLVAYRPNMSQAGVRPTGNLAHVGAPRPSVKPWVMAVQPDAGAPVQAYGVYWHNRFGLPSAGAHIELPTFAARWLYDLVVSVPAGDVPVIIE